jgi:hypothetical protein
MVFAVGVESADSIADAFEPLRLMVESRSGDRDPRLRERRLRDEVGQRARVHRFGV